MLATPYPQSPNLYPSDESDWQHVGISDSDSEGSGPVRRSCAPRYVRTASQEARETDSPKLGYMTTASRAVSLHRKREESESLDPHPQKVQGSEYSQSLHPPSEDDRVDPVRFSRTVYAPGHGEHSTKDSQGRPPFAATVPDLVITASEHAMESHPDAQLRDFVAEVNKELEKLKLKKETTTEQRGRSTKGNKGTGPSEVQAQMPHHHQLLLRQDLPRTTTALSSRTPTDEAPSLHIDKGWTDCQFSGSVSHSPDARGSEPEVMDIQSISSLGQLSGYSQPRSSSANGIREEAPGDKPPSWSIASL